MYSCSGASSAAQMANHIAVKLDRQQQHEDFDPQEAAQAFRRIQHDLLTVGADRKSTASSPL
jgi:uncharacterized metal-binding protein